MASLALQRQLLPQVLQSLLLLLMLRGARWRRGRWGCLGSWHACNPANCSGQAVCVLDFRLWAGLGLQGGSGERVDSSACRSCSFSVHVSFETLLPCRPILSSFCLGLTHKLLAAVIPCLLCNLCLMHKLHLLFTLGLLSLPSVACCLQCCSCFFGFLLLLKQLLPCCFSLLRSLSGKLFLLLNL